MAKLRLVAAPPSSGRTRRPTPRRSMPAAATTSSRLGRFAARLVRVLATLAVAVVSGGLVTIGAGLAQRAARAAPSAQTDGASTAEPLRGTDPQAASFAAALAGLVNTLRSERGLAPLPHADALERVAADAAGALARSGGVPAADAHDDASLRLAVAAAGWIAPPDLSVRRAFAVRRSLEQAADWFVRADNPDGAALFDPAATAIGAGAAGLGDGRTAWVVVTAAGAPPPPDATAVVEMAAATPPAAFAVTALPPPSGEAFGPALPGVPAAPDDGALVDWTQPLQQTARIVVVLVVLLFALRALGLRGPERR